MQWDIDQRKPRTYGVWTTDSTQLLFLVHAHDKIWRHSGLDVRNENRPRSRANRGQSVTILLKAFRQMSAIVRSCMCHLFRIHAHLKWNGIWNVR